MQNKSLLITFLLLTLQSCNATLAYAVQPADPGNSNNNNNSSSSTATNTVNNTNNNTVNNSTTNNNNVSNTNETSSQSDSDSNSTSGSTSESDAVSDSSNSVRIEYDVSSASAAPVFSSSCSSGASVQGVQGGFSAGTVNVVCRNLMMADAYLRLAGLALTEEMQIRNMDKAVHYLEKAGMVVDRTSKTGFVAQVASDLSIPLAALLLLLLL